MATTIRPELSEKNPYWIEKHRYYELKHFCLQYPIWQKQYSLISNTRSNEAYSLTPIANQSFYDSTGETAVDRTYYSLRIRAIFLTLHRKRFSRWRSRARLEPSRTHSSFMLITMLFSMMQ